MSDVARCTCPKDSTGQKCGRNLDCPFHGFNPADPQVAWSLNPHDRAALRRLRIDPEDTEAIQQVRQAEEDRWRRD